MGNQDVFLDIEECKEAIQWLINQGEEIEQYIEDYICIIKKIKEEAIEEGKMAESLNSFISRVEQLNSVYSELVNQTSKTMNNYINDMVKTDQFKDLH